MDNPKVLLTLDKGKIRVQSELKEFVTRADFDQFNAIATTTERYLGRELSEVEAIVMQAMLGSNSVSEMQIGPGAQMCYELK